MLPVTEAGPAALAPQDRDWDILLTAETHNFPCAVAPYPGTYSTAIVGTVIANTIIASATTDIASDMFVLHPFDTNYSAQ